MPRIARIVVPGTPHHVTQRGNNRQDVFNRDDDRKVYLEILKRNSDRFDLRIAGYCLMRNHIHLIAIPRATDSLAKAVGHTHSLYTSHFNHCYGRSGHLWQNRFFSCPMDDRHALAGLCYVERNPTRAGLTLRPWDYDWSSAKAHCGGEDSTGLLDLRRWESRIGAEQWRKLLTEWDEREVEFPVRERTQAGRPLGDDRFLRKVEMLLGREIQVQPVGRPRAEK